MRCLYEATYIEIASMALALLGALATPRGHPWLTITHSLLKTFLLLPLSSPDMQKSLLLTCFDGCPIL
jgi:hypothetical protein